MFDPCEPESGLIRTKGHEQPVINSWVTKLSLIVAACAYLTPGEAQIVKKEPDASQLLCGQKVLVDNNTCPADEILQVTGSCLNTTPTIDIVLAPRGTQFNCVKRKRE